MSELVTPRLVLRRFSEDDAPFALELLNDPDWVRYIGDNGVRTLDDARAYLREGPIAMYARFGFGLLAVDLKDGGQTIGDLVNHADRRLYLAKQKGRNRICVNDEGKSSFA